MWGDLGGKVVVGWRFWEMWGDLGRYLREDDADEKGHAGGEGDAEVAGASL